MFDIDVDVLQLIENLRDTLISLEPNTRQRPGQHDRFMAQPRAVINCGRNISSCYTTSTHYLMRMFREHKQGLLIVSAYPHYPGSALRQRAYSCACAWSVNPGHRAPGLPPHV